MNQDIVDAWNLALSAKRWSERLERDNSVESFALSERGRLLPVATDHPTALITWWPGVGWESSPSIGETAREFLELYLSISSATPTHPMIVGHLGQSLDGFIATHSGDSQFVTGRENILHLHRMRALCDAVVVGAGTVAADNPQLTTRHVAGPNPIRVVFDPGRRLTPEHTVFTDDASGSTLYACAKAKVAKGETLFGRATIVGLDSDIETTDVADLVRILRERGCSRIFVEGGGVTVSAFLEANLFDRMHVAIAPLIIGDGRPAIRLAARDVLRDCRRPSYRVFRMGGDVLFDCDLRAEDDGHSEVSHGESLVRRII